MKQRNLWALACAAAILGSEARALDPVSFQELSLFLRMGEKTEFIVGEVQKRQILRSLTEQQLAILKSQGASEDLLREVQRPERLAPAEVAAAVEKRTSASVADRFKQNMQKSGGLAGKPGVNAVTTPMGRYNRRLSQQIQSIWTLKEKKGITPGTVRVRVQIQPGGKFTDVAVVDGGGNRPLAEIGVSVLREVRPEPLPPEAELTNGVLEMTFSFSLY